MKYLVTYYYIESGQRYYHSDIFDGIPEVVEVLDSINTAIKYELVSVVPVK